MNDIIATLLGVIAGSVLTCGISIVLLKVQIRAQRKWEIVQTVAPMLGKIFNRYLLESIESKPELAKLRVEWGERSRLFMFFQGRTPSAYQELVAIVNDYLEAVSAVMNGEKDAVQLECLRLESKEATQEKISEIVGNI